MHRNSKIAFTNSLTFLSAPIPVLPDFGSVVHQQGVKEVYEWLERAYDDKTSYWVPWAKHHTETSISYTTA